MNELRLPFHHVANRLLTKPAENGKAIMTVEENQTLAEVFEKTPTELLPLLLQLYRARNRGQMMETLSNATRMIPGFELISANEYQFRNFSLVKGIPFYNRDRALLLQALETLEISSVPKLAGHISPTGYDSVLVSAYNGEWGKEDRLIPVIDASGNSREKVSPESREVFWREIQILLRNDLYFPYVAESIRYLFVNPVTGEVVVPAWEQIDLMPKGNAARQEYLQKIRGHLNDLKG